MTAISATDTAGPTPLPRFPLDTSAPVGRLLEQTTTAFEGVGMPLARRWARTFMAAVLDVPHRELNAHAGRTLSAEQRLRFDTNNRDRAVHVRRRAAPVLPARLGQAAPDVHHEG